MSLPIERILRSILVLRGEKMMLDADLAAMYGVETGALVRAVKRNPGRFPPDFMFQLDSAEWKSLKSQFGISSSHGGRSIAVNMEIMRAFVQLKRMMATNQALAPKLDALEGKYDRQFKIVFDAIRALMEPPIGFRSRP